MPRKKVTGDVSRPNPFRSNSTPPPPKQPPSGPMLIPFDNTALAVLQTELTTARQRVEALERQLADEQAGRRADLERLLREQADLRATVARLEAEAAAKAKPAE